MRDQLWMVWALLLVCCAGCAVESAGKRVRTTRSLALKPAAAAALQDCPPEVVRPQRGAVAVAEPQYRQDRIPYAAIPAAVGTAVNGWESAMICESQLLQQVLPRHSWYAAGAIPGPEGRRRIEQFSEQMRDSTTLLVLEAEPVQPEYDEGVEEAIQRTEDLNSRRRAWVVGQLAAGGVVNAEQRVVFSSEHLWEFGGLKHRVCTTHLREEEWGRVGGEVAWVAACSREVAWVAAVDLAVVAACFDCCARVGRGMVRKLMRECSMMSIRGRLASRACVVCSAILWSGLLAGCAGLDSLSSLTGAKAGLAGSEQRMQAEACRATGEQLAAAERDEQAIAQMLRARQLNPGIRGTAHPLAVLYDRQRMLDAAEREYQQALRELPRSADVRNDYGYFLYSRGDYLRGEAELRAALKLRPDHPQARLNLCWPLPVRGVMKRVSGSLNERWGGRVRTTTPQCCSCGVVRWNEAWVSYGSRCRRILGLRRRGCCWRLRWFREWERTQRQWR